MAHPARRRLRSIQASAPSLPIGRRRSGGVGAVVGMLLASSSLSHAQTVLPSGGRVTAGSATIGVSGGDAVVIDQTSQRAVIEWDGFSIGAGGTVAFNQPGVQAAVLNRVTGAAASTIAGTITANGQVFLVNPNGIAITAGGTVAVGGGFVASTLDIGDRDFLDGRLGFAGDGGLVSNAGAIRIGSGGFAALLGGRVANTGTIAVPLGRIALGSGQRATLDLSGDGFLQVVLPAAADGDDPLVTAAGRLSGARIELRAASVAGAIRSAVNVPGELSARGAHRAGGVVVLDGGEGGATEVSGTIDASAVRGPGGGIAIGGGSIALVGATLDAAGATGGTVSIGGGGGGAAVPGLATADTTAIDAATRIDASGTRGAGGTVTVWGGSALDYAGRIVARGAGGDGGDAEVSGHGAYGFTGSADLGATGGRAGTLLLDPYNVTISSGSDAGTSGFAATASGATINTTTLQNALATANVTVSTGSSGAEAGNITVANAVSWSAGTALTLSAAGAIVLNGGIANSGSASGLTLIANGTGGISGAGALANAGTLTLNPANAAAAGTLSGIVSGAGALTKTGSGTVTLAGANTYTGGTTVGAGTLVANLNASQNALGTGAASVAGGAVLELNNTNSSNSTVTIGNSFSGAGELHLNLNDTSVTSTLMAGVTGMTGQILLSSTGTTGDKWTETSFGGTIAAALTVNSGSTFFLSGQSLSFTGGISVSGTGNSEGYGPLRVEGGATLGGNITLLGNTRFGVHGSGGTTFTGNITSGVAGNVTLTTAPNGYVMNLAGNISDGAGIVSLAANSATVLKGADSFSGGITLSSGTLQIAGAGSLGGGTYAGAISLASGSTFEYSASAAQTLSGVISGAGGVTKDTGTSVLTLAGTDTYTGASTIAAGRVQIGGSGTLGAGSYAGAIAVASGATFEYSSSAAQVLSGVVSGAGGLAEDGGAALLTLSGSNTYTGATSVSAGTLKAQSSTAFGVQSAVTLASGATLDLNGSTVGIGSLAGTGGTVTNNGSGAATLTTGGNNASTGFAGAIQNGNAAVSLVQNGSGTLTLSGTNTYTGSTTVSAGTLLVSGAGTLGGGSYAGALSVASGAGFTDTSSVNQSFAALATGTGTINLSGTGSDTISGNQNFSGTLNVNQATAFSGMNNAPYGGLHYAAAITVTGATLTLATADNTLVGAFPGSTVVTLNAGGTLLTNAYYTTNLPALVFNGGTLTSTGTLGGDASGYGVFNYEKNVSVTANSTISAATGVVGESGGTNFAVSPGVTLTWSGALNHVAGTTETGLNLSGGGTLLMTGTNTFTSAIAINAGTLQLGGAGSLGSGGYAGAIAIATGATLKDSSTAAQTLSGVISGAGALTKDTASSILTLTGTDSYSGATTIGAGTVQIGGAGTLGSGSYAGVLSVATGANFEFSSSAVQALSGVISGAGGLTKDTGTAILTLLGANTYTGATTVSAGTLKAQAASAFGVNSAVVLANGGTLDINGGTLAIGSLAGAGGTVTNNFNSGGTLTIGGDNTTTSFAGNVLNGTSGGVVSLVKSGSARSACRAPTPGTAPPR